MMVSTGGHERGTEATGSAHHVKADEIAPEVDRLIDVSDVKVHMAHLRAGRKWNIEGIARGQLGQQNVQIDGVTTRTSNPVLVLGPESVVRHEPRSVFRRLRVDLNSVAVGIREVVGLRHDVIRWALRVAERQEPRYQSRQVPARRDKDGEMVEAGGPGPSRLDCSRMKYQQFQARCPKTYRTVFIDHFQTHDIAIEVT